MTITLVWTAEGWERCALECDETRALNKSGSATCSTPCGTPASCATLRYDMAKANLDRHAAHAVAAYLAGRSTG